MTHAIWPDVPGRIVRACCGVTIARDEAVATPTCPDCSAALDQFEHLAIE